MIQEKIYEQTVDLIKPEIIEIEKEVPKEETEKKNDKSIGISNPRYYENARTPKKAKIELWAKYGDLL